MPRILAISTGKIAPLFVSENGQVTDTDADNVRIMSAIYKTPVSTLQDPLAINIKPLGLEGDEQADLSVHGGRDKAIYAYPHEHYPVWETMRLQTLKREEKLPFGAMGENLSIAGLLEEQVWIGDTLVIGDEGVRVRVASPRQPCFKFNARMGFRHAAKMMVQSGYTGFYLEVLQTGRIKAGDAIEVLPGARHHSVMELHRMQTRGKQRDLL